MRDSSSSTSLQVVTTVDDPNADLLSSFPKLTCHKLTSREPGHGVLHFIPNEGCPVFSHPRHFSHDDDWAAKAEFHSMLKMGITRPLSSQLGSPLHNIIVSKPNGEWHLCSYYHQLNQVFGLNRYQIHHIQDFASSLASIFWLVFSKVDLIWGYHQVPTAVDMSLTVMYAPCEWNKCIHYHSCLFLHWWYSDCQPSK